MVHYRLSSDLPRHLLKETYHNAQYYWTNEKILLTFFTQNPDFYIPLAFNDPTEGHPRQNYETRFNPLMRESG